MIRALASGILLAGILAPLGGTAHRETEEGNRFYDEGSFEDALRAYTEAQVAAPEAPELHYDIGNVLCRQGDFKGAAEAFTGPSVRR
jgi:Ca-activated chloride channel family protein